ncbi:AraC family transcriptional regulator [Aquimarina sp. ERC-38]|uniref:AraC family transcriptional regulator n=1 Tax=Aquimarina sp. ERC-38 TaxID=2949996 RepID=UPI00224689C9|nr:AraC family transcriptional regulator [Aquimarina sp. ERC-38]UZO81100.1 AraC family transcriptional regulator [Aquimarina sp. ERC-38]
MRTIEIHSVDGAEILEQLNQHLHGNLKEQWGEYVLEFKNDWGSGTIRSIAFDWGISLVDYDVNFKEELKLIFQIGEINPIEFVFISEGNLKYYYKTTDQPYELERYQNIIISPEKQEKEVYIFPKSVDVKVNFIYIIRNEYFKKKNNNLSFLSESLYSTFQDDSSGKPYKHQGNFNLKIADQIRQLQENYDTGIVRTLTIEGQLNLILAMQMLEQSNFESGQSLPDSLSKTDIRKINQLAGYIIDNISEPLTISTLSMESGLSSKKLQAGFRTLYSKSVNEYIRQLKLEVSRDLIRNTDDSISEIVYKIGFKSRSYFSKIFSERYGILPTEYRKKIKVK